MAKKFHHRGDRATARDLYDLCAVATLEPRAISIALPFTKRHGQAFLDGIHAAAEPLKAMARSCTPQSSGGELHVAANARPRSTTDIDSKAASTVMARA